MRAQLIQYRFDSCNLFKIDFRGVGICCNFGTHFVDGECSLRANIGRPSDLLFASGQFWEIRIFASFCGFFCFGLFVAVIAEARFKPRCFLLTFAVDISPVDLVLYCMSA